jgi:hypothetical protein
MRRIVAVVALALVGLGCGFVNQAKNVIDTAAVLGDFADRLGRSATLTYTAEYQVTGGQQRVTLAQDPPKAAFLADDGRFIFTAEHMIICGSEPGGTTTCQRAPNRSTQVDAASAGFVAGVAGPGFVTPEVALGMVAAAALVPGAKVDSSSKEIAGQPSLCANVTGLENASTAGTEDVLKDFTVCVTEVGILASFSGTLADGQRGAIELASYRDTVDAGAFEVPAGATVTDVAKLGK